MVIEFDKDYLAELYFEGKASDKKHRFQPQVARKYVKVVDLLEASSRIEDLFRFRSLNYEVLIGDKKGIESVRVDNQYRLEFKTSVVGGETVITICRLLELSNHYQ